MKKEIEVKKEKKDKPISSVSHLIPEFERRAEKFFEDRISGLFGDWPTFSTKLSTNIHEMENAYILYADLPGIPKENIDIRISGNMLTIHAEYKKEISNAEADAWLSRESRAYHQSFTLPNNVVSEQIEAIYENGRLEVVLPKNGATQQRKVEVYTKKSEIRQTSANKNEDLESANPAMSEKH